MKIYSFLNLILSGQNKILPAKKWTPRVLNARLTSRHGLLDRIVQRTPVSAGACDSCIIWPRAQFRLENQRGRSRPRSVDGEGSSSHRDTARIATVRLKYK